MDFYPEYFKVIEVLVISSNYGKIELMVVLIIMSIQYNSESLGDQASSDDKCWEITGETQKGARLASDECCV